jgi:hypothetical protein
VPSDPRRKERRDAALNRRRANFTRKAERRDRRVAKELSELDNQGAAAHAGRKRARLRSAEVSSAEPSDASTD